MVLSTVVVLEHVLFEEQEGDGMCWDSDGSVLYGQSGVVGLDMLVSDVIVIQGGIAGEDPGGDLLRGFYSHSFEVKS